jgi:4-amino-4-deoxy-L-arabinose transferase-like glycosyltransferase
MFSIKNEKPWIKALLPLIVAFVLIFGSYTVLSHGDYFLLGSIEKLDNDDVRYIKSAITLLEKGIFTYHNPEVSTVFIMPGHTIILAGIMKVFGTGNTGIVAFRIFQVMLQGASIYLLFLLARKIFNSRVAIVTCILSAIYLPEITTPGMILTEVEFKFLFLLLIYLTVFAVITKKVKYYLVGGVVWAFACLIRPTVAPYPIVVLMLWLINKYSIREMIRFSALAILVFALIMSPWWIRNYNAFNRFIPLTLSSGNPFLLGTYVDNDLTKDFTPYQTYEDVIKNNESEMETGKLRFKKYIKEKPLEYIKWYTIGKTIKLWEYPFYWKNVYGLGFNEALYYHLFILKVGILGAAIVLFKKTKGTSILFLTIIYSTLIYLPFYTFSRYSYPVMPLIMALGGYGVTETISGIFRLGRSRLRLVTSGKLIK